MNCQDAIWILIIFSLINVREAKDDKENSIFYEKKLYNDLLKNYNKFIRPVKNPKNNLEVSFGISLQQILNVDETREQITLNEWLNLEWNDFQLKWNRSDYGNLNSLRIQPEEIWTPDIDPYNGGHVEFNNPKHSAVVAYSDGTISFVPKQIMTYSCSFDLTAFPFDTQYCKLKYGSWTYDGSKLNLTSRVTYMDLSTYQENKEWVIIDVPMKRNVLMYDCCPEPYIDVTATIEIKRRTKHYFHAMVAPSLAMALLLPTLFLLPPDSPGKMSLGVGVLVCNAILFALLQMGVPKSGLAIPVIGKYFLANMVLCALSITIAALVMNIWKKGNRAVSVPSVIRTVILGVFGRLCCVPRDDYMAVEEGTDEKDTSANVVKATNAAEWRQLAVILDRFFFFLFLVLSLLICIALVR